MNNVCRIDMSPILFLPAADSLSPPLTLILAGKVFPFEEGSSRKIQSPGMLRRQSFSKMKRIIDDAVDVRLVFHGHGLEVAGRG